MTMTKTTTKTLTLTTLLAAIALVGCQNVVTTDPGHDDDEDPELTFQGDELRDSFAREGDRLVSPVLTVASGANRVALMATASIAQVAVFARGVDGDVVGPWVAADWTWSEGDDSAAGAAAAEALLAGRAELGETFAGVQIGVAAADADALDVLTFSAVQVDDGVSEFGDALTEPQLEAQALAPELAFVGVQPRSAWGARAPRCSTRDSSFNRIALHHTASRNTGNVHAMARQIQAYHMDGRGYCDAAYHFAVAQDGTIVELRSLPFRGGHTLNNNTQNIGVVFMGCFDASCGSDQPSAQLMEAGSGLVAMLSRVYGVAINADRVRGHRDHAGQSTACPGGLLHPRLGEIRGRAQQIKDGVDNAPPPPPGPPAAAGCGVLGVNQALGRGQAAVSCGGGVSFVHQGDGNVVVYDAGRGGRAVWASGTNGRATDALVMQGDGNLVLYAPGGRPIWSTGTHGKPNTVLAVQDDGNVVLYAPGARAVWASGTNR